MKKSKGDTRTKKQPFLMKKQIEYRKGKKHTATNNRKQQDDGAPCCF